MHLLKEPPNRVILSEAKNLRINSKNETLRYAQGDRVGSQTQTVLIIGFVMPEYFNRASIMIIGFPLRTCGNDPLLVDL